MLFFYYTKPHENWSGDDNGALKKAKALASFIDPKPLHQGLIQSHKEIISGKIVVNGTNLEDLLDQIKAHPSQFDLDKLTFIVGGNQTKSTLQFITGIRELNQNCKIEALIMPGTLDKKSILQHTNKNTKISISYNSIAGTTIKNVHKNLFEKDLMKELLSLEQQCLISRNNQNVSFATVHWGGAISGEGISDGEQELHKKELLQMLREIRKKHPQLQILFVPHRGRSFLSQENSLTTKEDRKQDFTNTLKTEFGATHIHTGLNYLVASEFTRKHQKQCAAIISTAENWSTIAEQCSILNPREPEKPPLHILLFPCCKFNNTIWKKSKPHHFRESWLSNVKLIRLLQIGLPMANEKQNTLAEVITVVINQSRKSQIEPNLPLRKNTPNQGR